jgi:sensor histidine kinase regulating citrate/malate metabolism
VRGVELHRPSSLPRAMRIDPHNSVSMLGSLIDNVIDATGMRSPATSRRRGAH